MRWYYRGVAGLGLLALCGCGALDARRPVGLQVVNLSPDLPQIGLRVDGQELLVTERSHQDSVPYQHASREIQLNPGHHRIEVLSGGEVVLTNQQAWAEGRHGCLQVLGRANALAAEQALGLLVVQRTGEPDADHAGIRMSHALAGGNPIDVEVVPSAGEPIAVAAGLAYGRVSSQEPLPVPRGAVRLRIRQGDELLWDQVYQLSAGTVYNFAFSGPDTAPTVVAWDGC